MMSEQGALVATAGNNVNLTSAQTTRDVDEAHQFKGSSSLFSKKTITTRNTLPETTTQGTTFSGNTTYVQAGSDINVKGGNVVSTDGTTLIAKHDVNIESATNSTTERQSRLTVAVIAAIPTAQQMSRAAGQASDGPIQVPAGATTALAGKNAADTVIPIRSWEGLMDDPGDHILDSGRQGSQLPATSESQGLPWKTATTIAESMNTPL
ncbi:hemagglutinin repeat-containing protein [Ralstonia nicotianae]|nr:hemagglutinin repeat-containing protein [Ralstonia pseudosolanacearum]OIT09090.1 hypothetical protein BL241_23975 [Ralstonia solanacearum]AST88349.1 hypothetical protein CIG66_17870 [Ralstonia pseudosolanacearum]MDK1383608.1 hemagglutinin repeat-containing protein [Ralstonia pseudosolanacearum]OIT10553.1 hypothetical protein BL243_24350 [Ralstonia solanacearum]UNJ32754.1 hemagglutinin repeat-containing protein [Ralstonia pseudosolanacearum]